MIINSNNYYIFIFVLFFVQIFLTNQECIPYKNNCEVCNSISNHCIKCLSDRYFPDENGGCEPICTLGKNYCNQCSENSKLCISCEEGYFPDKTGGCSYIANCELSYKGKCLKCEEDYILIGDNNNFQICKNKYSEDLKYCKNINILTGLCDECEENFFLNKGDFKCSEIANCFESIYSVCTSCNNGYYLNKKENKCLHINENFIYCKETIDGEKCEDCILGFYLAEDGKCSNSLMCQEAQSGICIKCIDNYYLTEDNFCTKEENCQYGDGNTGLCDYCYSGYYLDKKDKKCKKQNGDEFIHCEVYDNGCLECELNYYRGEDLKCTKTKNCHQSENEKCIECREGYYLGHDNKCSFVEHCIYSGGLYECEECEEGYYFSRTYKNCLKDDENFQHCKIAIYDGSKCGECKKDYYLNKTNYLCYDNTDKNNKFYKCEYTDYQGEKCAKCLEGYFFSLGDEKCLTIDNCKYSNNEGECIVCDDYYCLDVKNQKCVDNDFLEDENQKIFIACNRTNKEGDRCELCLDGYEVDENGYCIDVERCEEKENGICKKCKDDDQIVNGYYCANEIYGCLKTYNYGCKQCNDIKDLYSCTECQEGYYLNERKRCIRIINE